MVEKSYNVVQKINFYGGATWFLLRYDLHVDHFDIKNCKAILSDGGDNTGFVYAQSGSEYVSIRKCNVTGPGLLSQGIHPNSCCIIAANSYALHIDSCTLTNAPLGINLKHGNMLPDSSKIVLENNFIYNTDRCGIFVNASRALIQNNILGINCTGIRELTNQMAGLEEIII